MVSYLVKLLYDFMELNLSTVILAPFMYSIYDDQFNSNNLYY